MNYKGLEKFIILNAGASYGGSVRTETAGPSVRYEFTNNDSEMVVTEEYSENNQAVLETSTQQLRNWTVNETKLLLDLHKKFRVKVGTHEIKNLRRLWEVIANEINKILNSNVHPHHCENRWRVLDRAYKKYIDNKNKTGQGRKFFEYAQEMDEIFRGKKNVKPVILLSNESVEQISESEAAKKVVDAGNSCATDSTTSKSVLTAKRKGNPVLNRNNTLMKMREDKKQYHKERIELEKEKLMAYKEKLSMMKERNILLKERNKLLKDQKCSEC